MGIFFRIPSLSLQLLTFYKFEKEEYGISTTFKRKSFVISVSNGGGK